MKPINYKPCKTSDFLGCSTLLSRDGSCLALMRQPEGTVNIFYRENIATSWQTVGYVSVNSEAFLTSIDYDPQQKVFTLSLSEGGEDIKLEFSLSPLSKWCTDAQRVKLIGYDATGVVQDLVIDREGGFGVIVKVDGSEDFYEVSPSDLIAI